jgi:hypothetical protein
MRLLLNSVYWPLSGTGMRQSGRRFSFGTGPVEPNTVSHEANTVPSEKYFSDQWDAWFL